MGIEIEGVSFLAAAEVVDMLGISRQTLWRWRQQGKIPQGHRYRGKNVVFTAEQFEQIRQFANRVEEIEDLENGQLRLFQGLKPLV
jgi:predicted DNA-binding transcriptional regulator AlpA